MTLLELRLLFVVGLLVTAALAYVTAMSAEAVMRGVARLGERLHAPYRPDMKQRSVHGPQAAGRVRC